LTVDKSEYDVYNVTKVTQGGFYIYIIAKYTSTPRVFLGILSGDIVIIAEYIP